MRRCWIALALVLAGCATPAPQATWAEYSLMGTTRGAEIHADGQPASRFAWSNAVQGEAHIRWGDPRRWPPSYRERFRREGDWVMLDGWWDNGTYYRLALAREEVCDATCARCTPLAGGGGPQHYVRWQVPAQAYCLRAAGRIIEESSGKSTRFEHEQVWHPPGPCRNAAFGHHACIRQLERWWDDNGAPFALKLERTNWLALGLGPGFIIEQTLPKPWRAEMNETKETP
jgi:hypothetical protein